jgi:hypothetical protein
MRIAVTDIGCTFGRQTRAYTEYRMFASMARFSDAVCEARVTLASARVGGEAHCVVVLVVSDGSRLRVSARGRHACDAVNRAAERAADMLRRRMPTAPPPQNGAEPARNR